MVLRNIVTDTEHRFVTQRHGVYPYRRSERETGQIKSSTFDLIRSIFETSRHNFKLLRSGAPLHQILPDIRVKNQVQYLECSSGSLLMALQICRYYSGTCGRRPWRDALPVQLPTATIMGAEVEQHYWTWKYFFYCRVWNAELRRTKIVNYRCIRLAILLACARSTLLHYAFLLCSEAGRDELISSSQVVLLFKWVYICDSIGI